MNKVKILSLLSLAIGTFYLPFSFYAVLVSLMMFYLIFKGRGKEVLETVKRFFFFFLMFSPYFLMRFFFVKEGTEYRFWIFTFYSEAWFYIKIRLLRLASLYFLSSFWFKIFVLNLDKGVPFFESVFLAIEIFPSLFEPIREKKNRKNWKVWLDQEYRVLLKNFGVAFQDESHFE